MFDLTKRLGRMVPMNTSTVGGLSKGVPDSKFLKKELALGIKQEMREHGLVRATAKSVAKDHLMEDPRFYTNHK